MYIYFSAQQSTVKLLNERKNLATQPEKSVKTKTKTRWLDFSSSSAHLCRRCDGAHAAFLKTSAKNKAVAIVSRAPTTRRAFQ